jgi:hypothetical protein
MARLPRLRPGDVAPGAREETAMTVDSRPPPLPSPPPSIASTRQAVAAQIGVRQRGEVMYVVDTNFDQLKI